MFRARFSGKGSSLIAFMFSFSAKDDLAFFQLLRPTVLLLFYEELPVAASNASNEYSHSGIRRPFALHSVRSVLYYSGIP